MILSDQSTLAFLNEFTYFFTFTRRHAYWFYLMYFFIFMNLFFDAFLRFRATFAVHLQGRPGKLVPASTVSIIRLTKQGFPHMQKECSKWWDGELVSRQKICQNQSLKNSGLESKTYNSQGKCVERNCCFMIGVLLHFKFELTIPHVPRWCPRLLVASARGATGSLFPKNWWWMSACLVAP